MTTTTLPRNEVAAFATAVRTALSDLPPDELDELTDGLEADLSERLDEAPDDTAGLGDPVAYAEELRAAAGYPPRAARSHLGAAMPNLRTLPQQIRAGWTALVERHAWLASALAFLAVLRPVWWVLRGAAAYAILASLLGVSGTALWFVGVAMVVLSVQVGRGRMQHRSWVRWTTHAVSAIVILFAPFLLGAALTAVNLATSTGSYEEPYSYRVSTRAGSRSTTSSPTTRPGTRSIRCSSSTRTAIRSTSSATRQPTSGGRCRAGWSSPIATSPVEPDGTSSPWTTRTPGRTTRTTACSTMQRSRSPRSRQGR